MKEMYVNKYITMNHCWTYTAPICMDCQDKLTM